MFEGYSVMQVAWLGYCLIGLLVICALGIYAVITGR